MKYFPSLAQYSDSGAQKLSYISSRKAANLFQIWLTGPNCRKVHFRSFHHWAMLLQESMCGILTKRKKKQAWFIHEVITQCALIHLHTITDAGFRPDNNPYGPPCSGHDFDFISPRYALAAHPISVLRRLLLARFSCTDFPQWDVRNRCPSLARHEKWQTDGFIQSADNYLSLSGSFPRTTAQMVLWKHLVCQANLF